MKHVPIYSFKLMLILTVFKINQVYKELRSLSINEWANKIWYVQVMVYYLTINKCSIDACYKT